MTVPEIPDAADDALDRALLGYVHAVALAAGVSAEGVTCEVTDTATAYVALDRRTTAYPGHDLMLVWGERRGWTVLLETPPTEAVTVLGATGGDTVVPPAEVARFVRDTLDQPAPEPPATVRSGRPDRTRLAARLRCRTSPTPAETGCHPRP